jgi:hypothetical protein
MQLEDIERHEASTFDISRPLDEALMVARRATFDPGAFTKRVLYHGDEWETLERWQARAVLVALAALEPDERWADGNKHGPHITDYERAELKRVGLS